VTKIRITGAAHPEELTKATFGAIAHHSRSKLSRRNDAKAIPANGIG
jgi:hypothetical protein